MPSKKPKPVTLDEIETFLDFVASRMEAIGQPDAELYLPIWRALTRERDKRIEAHTIFAAARDRLKRSQDRTAGQFS